MTLEQSHRERDDGMTGAVRGFFVWHGCWHKLILVANGPLAQCHWHVGEHFQCSL